MMSIPSFTPRPRSAGRALAGLLVAAALLALAPAPLLAGVADLAADIAETKIGEGASAGKVAGTGGDVLNVRTGPWGDIVGTLPEGAALEILGQEGDWLKIKYDGETRFVHSAYVERAGVSRVETFTGTVDTPGTVLNVRTGPWGEIIGKLPHGAQIEVLGQEGDWLKIKYNGRPAMVHKDFVRKGGEASHPPAAPPAPPAAGTPPAPPANEGEAPPSGTDPRFASSIAWGKAQIGRTDYSGWCLKFVANVYGAPAAGYDCAYTCFTRIGKSDSVQNVNNIPVGALVFFDWTSSDGHRYGHVGINLGNGMMLDTANNGKVGIQKIAGPYWSSRYLGWAMPPASWPGR